MPLSEPDTAEKCQGETTADMQTNCKEPERESPREAASVASDSGDKDDSNKKQANPEVDEDSQSIKLVLDNQEDPEPKPEGKCLETLAEAVDIPSKGAKKDESVLTTPVADDQKPKQPESNGAASSRSNEKSNQAHVEQKVAENASAGRVSPAKSKKGPEEAAGQVDTPAEDPDVGIVGIVGQPTVASELLADEELVSEEKSALPSDDSRVPERVARWVEKTACNVDCRGAVGGQSPRRGVGGADSVGAAGAGGPPVGDDDDDQDGDGNDAVGGRKKRRHSSGTSGSSGSRKSQKVVSSIIRRSIRW